MDHAYIEQFDLVDQYVMGKLRAEDSEQFEEHFVACSQCIDRLNTARDFRQGLRRLTVEQITYSESPSPRLPHWFPVRWSFWPSATVAALCLLIAATAGLIFLSNQLSGSRLEADRAKTSASDWQRRYEEQQQSSLSSEQQHQELEQGLRGQVRQLEAELESEQKQRYDKQGGASDRMPPSINLPLIVFNSVQGGTRNNSADINEINLPRSSANFVVSVPLEEEAKYPTYRLTILAGRRPFWSKTGAKPDRDNALTIGFSSGFFPAGDYLLIVEGVRDGKAAATVGHYPFRVTKR